jgi:predicted Zn-dependent protease with MMP-like domain
MPAYDAEVSWAMMPPGHQRRWARLQQAAAGEVSDLLRRLPAPVRDQARSIPVTFEPAPSRELVREGLDADTLGLFVGEAFPDSLAGPQNLPAQIILYLDNLWDYAGRDAPAFREEVRRTYLHELGHYLGLDEDDLLKRDLD